MVQGEPWGLHGFFSTFRLACFNLHQENEEVWRCSSLSSICWDYVLNGKCSDWCPVECVGCYHCGAMCFDWLPSWYCVCVWCPLCVVRLGSFQNLYLSFAIVEITHGVTANRDDTDFHRAKPQILYQSGQTSLVIPGHDSPLDITVFMDISVHPSCMSIPVWTTLLITDKLLILVVNCLIYVDHLSLLLILDKWLEFFGLEGREQLHGPDMLVRYLFT